MEKVMHTQIVNKAIDIKEQHISWETKVKHVMNIMWNKRIVMVVS